MATNQTAEVTETTPTETSRQIFRRDNPDTGVQDIYALEGDSARYLGPTEFSQYYSSPTNLEGGTNAPVEDLGVRQDLYNKYFPQTPATPAETTEPTMDTTETTETVKTTPTETTTAETTTQEPSVYDTISQDLADIDSSIETEIQAYNDQLTQYAETLDDRTKAIISNIQQTYANRKAQMKDTNERTLRGLTVAGIRSGRQRYANEIQTSILSAEERSGIQRLAELDAQEQMLILEAQSAADEKQLGILNEKMSNLLQIQEQKRQNVMDLYSISMDQEQLAMAKAQEQRQAIAFQYEQKQQEYTAGENRLSTLAFSDTELTPSMANDLAIQMGISTQEVQSLYKAEQAQQEATAQKAQLELDKLEQELKNSQLEIITKDLGNRVAYIALDTSGDTPKTYELASYAKGTAPSAPSTRQKDYYSLRAGGYTGTFEDAVREGLLGNFGGGGGDTQEGLSKYDIEKIDAFNSDIADAITKLDLGDWEWGTAFDYIKRKYPEVSNEAIDEALGMNRRAEYFTE